MTVFLREDKKKKKKKKKAKKKKRKKTKRKREDKTWKVFWFNLTIILKYMCEKLSSTFSPSFSLRFFFLLVPPHQNQISKEDSR